MSRHAARILVAVLASALSRPLTVWAQTTRHHTAMADAGAATHAAIPLRLTYVQGHRVRYVQRTTQSIGGVAGASRGSNATSSTMDLETLAVRPDGSADQRMRVVEVSITGDGIPASLRATLTHGMVGTIYEFTQDARGHVVSRRPPTGLPDDVRAMADGLAQSIDQLSPVFPDGPMAVGDTWHDHQTLHFAPAAGASLDMEVDVTYTLRSLRPPGSDGVRVAVVGVAMTLGTPEGSSLQGVPWRGAGSSTGELNVDLGHGCILASQSSGTMGMHLTVGARSVDIETRTESTLHAEAPR